MKTLIGETKVGGLLVSARYERRFAVVSTGETGLLSNITVTTPLGASLEMRHRAKMLHEQGWCAKKKLPKRFRK